MHPTGSNPTDESPGFAGPDRSRLVARARLLDVAVRAAGLGVAGEVVLLDPLPHAPVVDVADDLLVTVPGTVLDPVLASRALGGTTGLDQSDYGPAGPRLLGLAFARL